MKACFLGGTGIISTDVVRVLLREGWEVTLINRGNRNGEIPGVEQIICDVQDEAALTAAMVDRYFDMVADFICFHPAQAERDIRVFSGKTGQFIFISSASAYLKPPVGGTINESTPLINPYWEYSREKAACEKLFLQAFEEGKLPVTIVRPSHTFSDRSVPVAVHGSNGVWQVLKRMMEGKPVLVPGDGTSLWAVMSSRDFAEAFAGLCGNPHALGQAVQITSEELMTWNDIHKAVAAALGCSFTPCYVPSSMLAGSPLYDMTGNLLGDKAHSVIFDNSKLHHLVPHYVQKERFDQAVRRSVRNYLQTPALQKEDPEFDRWSDAIVSIMKEAAERVAAIAR